MNKFDHLLGNNPVSLEELKKRHDLIKDKWMAPSLSELQKQVVINRLRRQIAEAQEDERNRPSR